MYCLVCEPLVKLNEEELLEEYNVYYQYYSCPICDTRHVCTSQSGDMIPEYLDLCE